MTAATVGLRRQIMNLRAERCDRYGFNGDAWAVHIEGACGEMAVAKLLNRYWCGNLGDLDAADVGKLQVRTRSKHSYELILHPADADEDAWILVTGIAPEYRVHGWVTGVEGKKEEYWKDPAGGRPAFFVPQDALRPMGELPV